MRVAIVLILGLGLMPLADARSPADWDIDDARMARKIEIQVDKAGNLQEIEFHIDPARVPAAVREAMDKLHPGGKFTGAEKERQGGVLYYELTSEVNGMEAEAMFRPDGTLHAEENEVAASAVPEAVRRTVEATFPGAQVSKWEEIRDGSRKLVEYHVKLVAGGRQVKAMITQAGAVTGAVLEVPAEIEVPIPVR